MKVKRSVTRSVRAKLTRAAVPAVNVSAAGIGDGQSSESTTLSVRLPMDVVEKVDRAALMAGTDRNTVFSVILALDVIGRLGMGKRADEVKP
jgi:hypothetical protein